MIECCMIKRKTSTCKIWKLSSLRFWQNLGFRNFRSKGAKHFVVINLLFLTTFYFFWYFLVWNVQIHNLTLTSDVKKVWTNSILESRFATLVKTSYWKRFNFCLKIMQSGTRKILGIRYKCVICAEVMMTVCGLKTYHNLLCALWKASIKFINKLDKLIHLNKIIH